MSDKKIYDGGPAFPPSMFVHEHGPNAGMQDCANGMTRRQWLAGLAMQGLLSSCGDEIQKSISDEGDSVVHISYAMADAMIEFEEGESK